MSRKLKEKRKMPQFRCRWSAVFGWFSLIFALIFAILLGLSGSQPDHEDFEVILWLGVSFGILMSISLFLTIFIGYKCKK